MAIGPVEPEFSRLHSRARGQRARPRARQEAGGSGHGHGHGRLPVRSRLPAREKMSGDQQPWLAVLARWPWTVDTVRHPVDHVVMSCRLVTEERTEASIPLARLPYEPISLSRASIAAPDPPSAPEDPPMDESLFLARRRPSQFGDSIIHVPSPPQTVVPVGGRPLARAPVRARPPPPRHPPPSTSTSQPSRRQQPSLYVVVTRTQMMEEEDPIRLPARAAAPGCVAVSLRPSALDLRPCLSLYVGACRSKPASIHHPLALSRRY